MFNKLKKVHLLTSIAIVLTTIGLPISADQASINRGEKVFNEIAGIGCKSCHGEFGEGDLGVGPYIRGATEGTIRAAISGIDSMVIIRATINEDGIKDVVAYVENLGATKVVRTLSKRGRFTPELLAVYPGTNLQIVVNNSSFSSHTFRSDDFGVANLNVDPRKTGTIKWIAPEEEGEYKLYCADCKLKGQSFTIKVDKSEKRFNATSTASAVNRLSEM